MNSKCSVKRIICLLLAVLMLFATVGCKDDGPRKKVVIRNQIVVTPEPPAQNSDVSSDDNSSIIDTSSDDLTPSDTSSEDDTSSDFTSDETISSEEETSSEETTSRAKRPLINAADNEEPEVIPFDTIHKETFTPEFEAKNIAWDGPEGYVIVYSPALDKNGAPTNARVLAEKLKVFFNESDKVDLPVYKDNDPALEGVEKMIIVGNTAYYKSGLKENEFAVNLKGDKLVLEGGHPAMVEKSVDWFRTVKREEGKVATFSGKQDDFKSVVKLHDGEYVYVWGDEFDGEELFDSSKWAIEDNMPTAPDLAFIETKDVCYVENGRLRLTGIRYFAEDSAAYGYATHGSYDTTKTMAHKNGYWEFNAKLPFTQGCLPPIWLMSNPDGCTAIPAEMYNAVWTVELDIFETFSNGNQWDVSIHKYYKPYEKKIDGVEYNNGIVYKEFDDAGNRVNQIFYYGEDVSDKIVYPEGSYAGWGTITSWRTFYEPEENAKQMYIFEGKDLEVLNDTYHVYGWWHDANGYKVYLDGKPWLERDWDTTWDYLDNVDWCNNNNGFGFELYYYLILNQFLYTPDNPRFPADKNVRPEDLPISAWFDWVRLYQMRDHIDICTPAYEE